MIKFTKTYSYSFIKYKSKNAFDNPIWIKKQKSWLDLNFDISHILGEQK